MQNEPEKKLDRARLAATKWLPMSAIGAAIPFVIGAIMQLPVGTSPGSGSSNEHLSI